MATGGFEDVDLEDTHRNNNHHGESGRNYYPMQVSSSNYNYRSDPFNSILQNLGPILPLIMKIKNAILMLPALFIFCIISFVSYCTLFLALPFRIHQLSESGDTILGIFSLLLGILFICTAILTLTSFVRCVFTSSQVQDNPPTISSSNINSETCRTCPKCEQYKPSRAHHCSICSACVLKMDHHCPWVSNCVGYFNYKYFCLFIWFATLSCHISSLICFSQLFAILGHHSHNSSSRYRGSHSSWMMVNSLLTLAFGITLTCFSFFHLVLVLKGSTTIEFGSNGYQPYDLGMKKNFMAIFGDNCLLWFIPVPTMNGDGYEFTKVDEDNHSLLSHENVYHRNSDDDKDSQVNEDDDSEISDFSTDLTS